MPLQDDRSHPTICLGLHHQQAHHTRPSLIGSAPVPVDVVYEAADAVVFGDVYVVAVALVSLVVVRFHGHPVCVWVLCCLGGKQMRFDLPR